MKASAIGCTLLVVKNAGVSPIDQDNNPKKKLSELQLEMIAEVKKMERFRT